MKTGKENKHYGEMLTLSDVEQVSDGVYTGEWHNDCPLCKERNVALVVENNGHDCSIGCCMCDLYLQNRSRQGIKKMVGLWNELK